MIVQLLLLAEFEEKTVQCKMCATYINLKPGQFMCSYSELASNLGIKITNAKRLIRRLTKFNFIEPKSDHCHTIFSIKNWSLYQGIDYERTDKRTKGRSNGQPNGQPNGRTLSLFKKEEERRKNIIRLEFYDFAEKLRNSILTNFPQHTLKDQWSKDKQYKWADAFRKLHEIDKVPFEDIDHVISWVQQDEFWKKNILSATTFRKRWDRIYAGWQTDWNNPKLYPYRDLQWGDPDS